MSVAFVKISFVLWLEQYKNLLRSTREELFVFTSVKESEWCEVNVQTCGYREVCTAAGTVGKGWVVPLLPAHSLGIGCSHPSAEAGVRWVQFFPAVGLFQNHLFKNLNSKHNQQQGRKKCM